MLVLSRKKDEKILLEGLGITILVVDIFGDKVRLGIDAPPHIIIVRAELTPFRRGRAQPEKGAEDAHG
jgi:carbon storage regulator